jgi:glycerol-3-phosphate dehydrogenase (NAD(P)+)
MADQATRIAVLGAGSWGTALAMRLARNGLDVRLWGHAAEVEALTRDGENRHYLPGIPLPAGIRPVAELAEALTGADGVLVVLPSHAFRPVLHRMRGHGMEGRPLAWATKGLEPGSDKLLSEVAAEELGAGPFGVLSGPSFAREVAQGLPTAITVAASDPAYAACWAGYLHSDSFRAYTSDDLAGVQVGGAAKNVMAIGAGVADGLGFGANTRAALITRGLAEIMRLGIALGGRMETFMGLAGLGDLVLTCTDNQSRNRRMGLALARGLTVEAARSEIGQAVEGVDTVRGLRQKARALGIEMPITEQIYRVLFEGLDPRAAVQALLEREPKAEHG